MNPDLYLAVMITVCVASFITSLIVNRKKVKEEVASAIKQDITSGQMKIAEDRVSIFLQKHNIQPGTNIRSIGRILNVYEGGDDNRAPGQAHLGRPDKNGAMAVTFQRGLTYPERTFAFAHECGHIINNDAVPIDRPNGKHKPEVEQMADYVAAALLMPIDDVYTYLVKEDYKNASPKKRRKLTKALCKRYDVDNIIALRRIREVYILKESTPE